MADIANFSYTKFEDGTLTITMAPPVPIGGLDLEFFVTKRFGGDNKLIRKLSSSGYNGVSGITIISSGEGRINVTIDSPDTSGLTIGNYATQAVVTTSGRYKKITEGFMILDY